ncbi:DUF4253 domain-containing protein [Bythopirellula polymerisocia]|uniref:DUF4253 domain-containing protein n=1 Tax=Bythopirellula polymerisocia TaxID=2528003 RepID=UPI0018D276EF|nr:DUF4253 domain-containing protein [Bythopirellula polymerisocia]
MSDQEKAIAESIGFDLEVCEAIRRISGRKLGRLISLNDEYEPVGADGLSISVEREKVQSLLNELQVELANAGYMAFWSESVDHEESGDSVVVLKTSDPYEIILTLKTDGSNYEIANKDIVQRLRDWETRCSFKIIGAANSWVAVRFEKLPENICLFAEEVYEFCPDTVEQGVGLMNENESPELFEEACRLYPELSKRMQEMLDEQDSEFEKMDIPPELQSVLESGSGGFTTSTAMGIRLLAYSIESSKELFLWWD